MMNDIQEQIKALVKELREEAEAADEYGYLHLVAKAKREIADRLASIDLIPDPPKEAELTQDEIDEIENRFPRQLSIGQEVAQAATKKALAYLQSHGWVKLAEEQAPPEIFPEEWAHGMCLPDKAELGTIRLVAGWLIETQGFRRVVLPDSK